MGTVHRIDAQYLRTEINPQFVGVVPPSDVIIATTLEVEFESASGTIMIVVPYSTIEPIKQKLSSSFQTDNDMADSIWTTAVKEHIKRIAATCVVKLGEAQMTVGDLITLETGDIIPLNQEASGEVSIDIQSRKNEMPDWRSQRNRAVQITEIDRTVSKEMIEKDD